MEKSADGHANVDTVLAAVHPAGGSDPVAHVLGQLDRRRGELAAALDGQALNVRLVLVCADRGTTSHLLVFTPDGTVARVRHGGVLEVAFEPHVTLRGGGEDVVALVLGRLDTARALQRSVLRIHVPPRELVPRYPRLRWVLAAHLYDLANR